MHQAVKFLFFLLPMVYFHSTAALPKDRFEKMQIQADSSTYNYKTGDRYFEGHVKVDQGTTHLTADRLITKNNPQHKMQEAIAYGLKNLAHYWTLPKENDPLLYAEAKIIKLYPIQSQVTLEQNVLITQEENSFKGELITYNMQDQLIIVPANKKGRAVLIYNPDSNKIKKK